MTNITFTLACGVLAAVFGVVLWRESGKAQKGWRTGLTRLAAILLLLFAAGNACNIVYQMTPR